MYMKDVLYLSMKEIHFTLYTCRGCNLPVYGVGTLPVYGVSIIYMCMKDIYYLIWSRQLPLYEVGTLHVRLVGNLKVI